MNIHRPVITEKSLRLAAKGWYTFAIGRHARKEAVTKEIEKAYHVNVVTSRTIAMHGKVRRTGKRMIYQAKPDWKKIVVLVKPGQHIDAFEVTNEPTAEAPKQEQGIEVKKTKTEKKAEAKK